MADKNIVEIDPSDPTLPPSVRELCACVIYATTTLQKASFGLLVEAPNRPVMGNALLSATVTILTEAVASWVAASEYGDEEVLLAAGLLVDVYLAVTD